jgi:hypothetical protein
VDANHLTLLLTNHFCRDPECFTIIKSISYADRYKVLMVCIVSRQAEVKLEREREREE